MLINQKWLKPILFTIWLPDSTAEYIKNSQELPFGVETDLARVFIYTGKNSPSGSL